MFKSKNFFTNHRNFFFNLYSKENFFKSNFLSACIMHVLKIIRENPGDTHIFLMRWITRIAIWNGKRWFFLEEYFRREFNFLFYIRQFVIKLIKKNF